MTDVCLDEFTDHGHCGVLTPAGRVDNDATRRALRRDGRAARRGGRPRRRPQRDDGRPGRRHPRRARRRRPPGHGDPRVRGEVRLRLLRPLPRGRRVVAARATARPTSRTPPTSARRCTRSRSTSPRAPTSSWSSPPWPTSTSSARCARRSTCRWRRTTSPGSTRWSRPPRRTAGSTATAPSGRRSPRSGAPGADVVLTYWALEWARRWGTRPMTATQQGTSIDAALRRRLRAGAGRSSPAA